MKITLRKTVRAEIGELISPKTPTKTGVLTITGMLPSPVGTEPLGGGVRRIARRAPHRPSPHRAKRSCKTCSTAVRYLLTLKARPPFRLAGIEMVEQLQQVVPVSQSVAVLSARAALAPIARPGCGRHSKRCVPIIEICAQAADWLHQSRRRSTPPPTPTHRPGSANRMANCAGDRFRPRVKRNRV